MQCKKCGAEIKDGCLFCDKCGEAVQIVPDFDPEIDDLQIGIPNSEKKTEYEKTDQTTESTAAAETKLSAFFKKARYWLKQIKWGQCFITVVICCGVFTFFLSYQSVIEHQEPEAMQNAETESSETAIHVEAPAFELPEGVYTYYALVRLSSDNGTIYYTTDGTEPNETSAVYQKPIELASGVTIIRAFAIDENGNSSDIATATYTVEPSAPDNPVIVPQTGEYLGIQYMSIIVPEGCIAYYTMDGSDPTEDSEVYTGELLMPAGVTIFSAMLEDENGALSGVSQVIYTRTPGEDEEVPVEESTEESPEE